MRQRLLGLVPKARRTGLPLFVAPDTILLMPTVFVVLFGFVFGSAIHVPGSSNYREYMMPGMFVLGTGTARSSAMVDVAMDQARGVMDRLRSMPTNRLSVPLGQSGSEGLVGVYGLVVLMVYGLIVGWRPHHGLAKPLAAVGLLLLFRYTLAWVGTYLGLVIREASTAANLAPLTLPLTMVSNAFVPTAGMPTWLLTICERNPLSSLATATRSLFGHRPDQKIDRSRRIAAVTPLPAPTPPLPVHGPSSGRSGSCTC